MNFSFLFNQLLIPMLQMLLKERWGMMMVGLDLNHLMNWLEKENSGGGFASWCTSSSTTISPITSKHFHQITNTWVFFKIEDYFTIINSFKSENMIHYVSFVHQEEGGKKSKSISTWDEKGLVMYNKDHGMIAKNKHVISKHSNVLSLYKTQRNATNLIPNVHQPSSKRKKSTTNSIVDFFCNRIPYKKIDPSQE